MNGIMKEAIRSYQDADRFLQGRASRQLGHSTWVKNRAPVNLIDIVLHDTPVVSYFKDGRIRLDSGGYRTLTTRARINDCSPFVVTRVGREWFVKWKGHTTTEVPFLDGMTMRPDIGWSGDVDYRGITLEERREIRRRAQEHVRKYEKRKAQQMMREAVTVDLFDTTEEDEAC